MTRAAAHVQVATVDTMDAPAESGSGFLPDSCDRIRAVQDVDDAQRKAAP